MLFSNRILISLCLIMLSGCGFQPVFGEHPGSVIESSMKYIEISPIADRRGQILRNHLVQDINPLGGSKNSKFLLKVSVTESKQDLAIKKSEIATRANLNLVAAYSMVLKSSGAVVTKGSSHMITSYNILNETFGTIVAEKNARNRALREISADITSKLVSFFRINKNIARQSL